MSLPIIIQLYKPLVLRSSLHINNTRVTFTIKRKVYGHSKHGQDLKVQTCTIGWTMQRHQYMAVKSLYDEQ